jgi:hypothetical protein
LKKDERGEASLLEWNLRGVHFDGQEVYGWTEVILGRFLRNCGLYFLGYFHHLHPGTTVNSQLIVPIWRACELGGVLPTRSTMPANISSSQGSTRLAATDLAASPAVEMVFRVEDRKAQFSRILDTVGR